MEPLSVLPILDLESEEGRQRIARLFRYAQIGHCVSSVTHDVNNFLGAIMAYAELIGMESPLNQESLRMIDEIMGAVRKSSSLVNNLTAIARKERPNVNIVDPAQLVERVLDLRRYDLKATQIALESRYDANLPMLVCDQPKVEQALMYILSNAVEELKTASHRLIRVRVTPHGTGVAIEIWNSGSIVAEEHREAIFQPFFTTKQDDHLGLGLSVAMDLARLHHGELLYEPDRGFILRLPAEGPTVDAVSPM